MKILDIRSRRKAMTLVFGLILTILGLVWLAAGGLTNAQSDNAHQPALVQAATGTGFTYQGQINQSNEPANGSFSFQFALYDSATGGTQIGSTQAETIVVNNGLFTVLLNDAGEFGSSAFNGEARFLEITVDGNTLIPRQALTAAPYAQSLRPGAAITSVLDNAALLNLSNNGAGGIALSLESTGVGVRVGSASTGLQVLSAVSGVYVGSATTGLYVESAGQNGVQVASATSSGVLVNSANTGLRVVSAGGAGVLVDSAITGVNVASATAFGLEVGSAATGVRIASATNNGVLVDSASTGLKVDTVTDSGVWVVSAGSNGVVVESASTGVYVAGPVTNWAGSFTGNINVTGACTGCLLATFGINTGDSPLQPGDVVTLQGTRSGDSIGQLLLMEVGQAQAGAPVVGVVYGHGELVEVENGDGQMITQLVPREGAAQPGDYVHIVIYGPMQVRASALDSAIQLGDKLSVNDSGAARSLQTRELDGMTITESAPTIGMALESLEANQDGLIWVLVNPQ